MYVYVRNYVLRVNFIRKNKRIVLCEEAKLIYEVKVWV